MRIRTTIAAAAVAALLLVGCSSSDNGKDKPGKTPATTAATTKTPALSKAEVTRRCVNAIADRAANANGEVPSQPIPESCRPLSDDEYLDAYMEGIHQANHDVQDKLKGCLDDPACTSWPVDGER